MVHLLAMLIPNKAARRAVRNKLLAFEKRKEARKNDIYRKMSLVHNGDIWSLPSGIRFYLPYYPWEAIQQTIVNNCEFYEQKVLDSIKAYIPQGAVILDIGANIGNHSVFFAAICGARKVYAFEPVQETYRMLVKNIEINGFEKIIDARNIGLGDKRTKGEISAQYADNIGATSIKEASGGGGHSMRIERLDDLDLSGDKIDFCKIDAEGFELKALAGMKNMLHTHRPVVFVESFGANALEIKKLFHEMGYAEPIYYDADNWLFVPNK